MDAYLHDLRDVVLANDKPSDFDKMGWNTKALSCAARLIWISSFKLAKPRGLIGTS